MPAIEFDVHGNLTPYTVIPLSVDDFKQEFVMAFADSERRYLLFDAFLTQIIDSKAIVNEEFGV